MIGAALVLALAAAPAADRAWCERAREQIGGAPAQGGAALTRVEAVAGELFPAGAPVVARARSVIGDEGDFGQNFEGRHNDDGQHGVSEKRAKESPGHQTVSGDRRNDMWMDKRVESQCT